MASVTNSWGKGEKSKPHLNWVGRLGVENDLTFLAVQKEPLYSLPRRVDWENHSQAPITPTLLHLVRQRKELTLLSPSAFFSPFPVHGVSRQWGGECGGHWLGITFAHPSKSQSFNLFIPNEALYWTFSTLFSWLISQLAQKSGTI